MQGTQGIQGTQGVQGTLGNTGVHGTTGISTSPKSVTILSPEAGDLIPIFHLRQPLTLNNVSSYLNGATWCGITFSLKYGTYPSIGSGTSTITNEYTLTSLTGVTTETTFNNGTVPANNALWIDVKSVSGIVTFIHSSVYFGV